MSAAKAVVALVLVFLSALLDVWSESDPLTLREVVAAFVIAGGVWLVPNRPGGRAA